MPVFDRLHWYLYFNNASDGLIATFIDTGSLTECAKDSADVLIATINTDDSMDCTIYAGNLTDFADIKISEDEEDETIATDYVD